MKTSIIEVTDMLSVLTVDEVEKRFGDVLGVASATVNYAAKNATVRYDETLLEVADIKILVHQRGQHSAGESQDKNVSGDKPEDNPKHKHEQHAGAKPTPEAASASPPQPAMPKAAPVAAAAAPQPPAPAGNEQPGNEQPGKEQPGKEPAAAPHHHP